MSLCHTKCHLVVKSLILHDDILFWLLVLIISVMNANKVSGVSLYHRAVFLVVKWTIFE
jgi:hypothetical protein